MSMFENMVRCRVPTFLRATVGCAGLSYRHSLAITVSVGGVAFDVVGSDLAAGATPSEAAPRFVLWMAWYMAGYPIILALVSFLMRQFLYLEGFLHVLYVVCASLISIGVGVCEFYLFRWLRLRSAQSSYFLIVFVVVVLLASIIACLSLEPLRCYGGDRPTTDSAEWTTRSRVFRDATQAPADSRPRSVAMDDEHIQIQPVHPSVSKPASQKEEGTRPGVATQVAPGRSASGARVRRSL